MYKAGKILELITQHPNLSTKEVAKQTGSHTSYVQRIRNQMIHIGTGEPAEVAQVEQTVDAVLDARGSKYGPFVTHAAVTQQLKEVLNKHLYHRGKVLAPDQREALEMIFHKIGRIVNGDPDYDDSWVDIAGYAKLVADRLQGKSR